MRSLIIFVVLIFQLKAQNVDIQGNTQTFHINMAGSNATQKPGEAPTKNTENQSKLPASVQHFHSGSANVNNYANLYQYFGIQSMKTNDETITTNSREIEGREYTTYRPIHKTPQKYTPPPFNGKKR
jgi:hypothetical protein